MLVSWNVIQRLAHINVFFAFKNKRVHNHHAKPKTKPFSGIFERMAGKLICSHRHELFYNHAQTPMIYIILTTKHELLLWPTRGTPRTLILMIKNRDFVSWAYLAHSCGMLREDPEKIR